MSGVGGGGGSKIVLLSGNGGLPVPLSAASSLQPVSCFRVAALGIVLIFFNHVDFCAFRIQNSFFFLFKTQIFRTGVYILQISMARGWEIVLGEKIKTEAVSKK